MNQMRIKIYDKNQYANKRYTYFFSTKKLITGGKKKNLTFKKETKDKILIKIFYHI